MDEITPEPVSPEFAVLDAYLTDALRVPPLESNAANLLALAVIRRSESTVDGRELVGEDSTRGRGRKSLGRETLRQWTWFGGLATLIAFAAVFLMRHPRQDLGTTHAYATRIGQRATLLLDDGTRVTMAPRTTVRLVRFGSHARTIVLDGDAYFEVASSTRTPFIVQAGVTTTRVLGTAFEVKHYADDQDVRIAVATGKVLVSTSGQRSGVPLTAGHVLLMTDSTHLVKAVDNVESEIGWLGDQLLFQDAPLTKVLATLTRWYGYEFRSADSTLVRQNVTIGLSMQSSTEALATLEQILDVSLTVKGDTVTLTPMHGRTIPHQQSKHYDLWIPTREVGR